MHPSFFSHVSKPHQDNAPCREVSLTIYIDGFLLRRAPVSSVIIVHFAERNLLAGRGNHPFYI